MRMMTLKNKMYILFFLMIVFIPCLFSKHIYAREIFIDDDRCQKGYQISKDIVDEENKSYLELSIKKEVAEKELKNNLEKYKKSSENRETLIKYNESKKKLDIVKSKLEDFNKEKKQKSCVLVDINNADYNLYSNEKVKSDSYLLISDDFNTIVASKNERKQFKARDFTKYFLVSLIDEEIRNGNISKDYGFKIDDEIKPIQGYNELSSMGIKPGKYYKLYDLVKSISVQNYDDVVFALAFHLFGGQEKATEKLSNFLKTIGLKDTKIGNLFGLNTDDLPNKPLENITTAYDVMILKKYNDEKNSYFSNNVSYETKLSSYDKIKSFKKEKTIMDPNNDDWYYSGVTEYKLSSYKNKEFSGLYSINKLNQKFSLVCFDSKNNDDLYSGVTNLLKNAVNYKYSNIQISRKNSEELNKILELNKINKVVQVNHAKSGNDKITMSLEKTFALNLPDNYYNYLDYKVKMKDNIYSAPISSGSVIGEITIYDKIKGKIKMFNSKRIKLKIIANENIIRKNIFPEMYENIALFFTKWISSINNVN